MAETPLTSMDRLLIEQTITNEGPSMGVAYLLAILLGWAGGHRFYLGRPATGVLMLLTLGGFGIWILIDLFLIPGMVRQKRGELRRKYISAVGGVSLEDVYVSPPQSKPTPVRGLLIAGGLVLVVMIAGALGHRLDGHPNTASPPPAVAPLATPVQAAPTHHHGHRHAT